MKQTETLLHEFGHTIGLRHEIIDEDNYISNYK